MASSRRKGNKRGVEIEVFLGEMQRRREVLCDGSSLAVSRVMVYRQRCEIAKTRPIEALLTRHVSDPQRILIYNPAY